MRILFKCKGNICRSPAAEIYLKMRRPHWLVASVATTRNTEGQFFHPEMVKACRARNIPADPRRLTKWQGHYNDLEANFDAVYDLHELGVQDPYLTGEFKAALSEIIDFVDTTIINK